MKVQNKIKRSFLLVLVSIIYLIIGAIVFGYLESDLESNDYENFKLYIEIFERNHRINRTEFDELMNLVKDKKLYKNESSSKFMSSFSFCISLLALIGYGMYFDFFHTYSDFKFFFFRNTSTNNIW
jgi:hypothetical protein